MRILVVHRGGWSNLGSVVPALVLLEALRELRPARLDLVYRSSSFDPLPEPIAGLLDECVTEPSRWYSRYLPAALRHAVDDPARRRSRRLFSQYDAIVSGPGPGSAERGALSPSVLGDCDAATDLGVPFLIAGSSLEPLSSRDRDRVSRARLFIARESTTQMYLKTHGIPSIGAADLGFLYAYERHLPEGVQSIARPYRVLFLNMDAAPGEAPYAREQRLLRTVKAVAGSSSERLILATTDPGRDAQGLVDLRRQLGHPVVLCRSIAALVHLIAGARGVVSDCYYPGVCAAALGKPLEVLVHREQHKMLGLQGLVGAHDAAELKQRARLGLDALLLALRGTS